MALLDCSPLPDENCIAKLAEDIPLVELVNVLCHIIGLAKIEVNVLLSHATVHCHLFQNN